MPRATGHRVPRSDDRQRRRPRPQTPKPHPPHAHPSPRTPDLRKAKVRVPPKTTPRPHSATLPPRHSATLPLCHFATSPPSTPPKPQPRQHIKEVHNPIPIHIQPPRIHAANHPEPILRINLPPRKRHITRVTGHPRPGTHASDRGDPIPAGPTTLATPVAGSIVSSSSRPESIAYSVPASSNASPVTVPTTPSAPTETNGASGPAPGSTRTRTSPITPHPPDLAPLAHCPLPIAQETT
jgi:hypothetical protein